MGTLVFSDAYVSIDGNDVSDHVQSVSLDYGANIKDFTAMGDGTEKSAGGLKVWSITLNLFQDFASSNVDSILFPLVGTTFTVAVKPVNTTTSATNPSYNGTGMLSSYPVFGGSVGDEATTSITINSAGTLARSTS